VIAKIFIIILMVLMIGSLGFALYYMMTDRGRSDRTVNALAARVGIWVVLFAFIAIGVGTGFIKPSGSLTPRQAADETEQTLPASEQSTPDAATENSN